MDRFSKAVKEYTEQCQVFGFIFLQYHFLLSFALPNQKPPEELLVKSFQKNSESLGQVRDLGWVLFLFIFPLKLHKLLYLVISGVVLPMLKSLLLANVKICNRLLNQPLMIVVGMLRCVK